MSTPEGRVKAKLKRAMARLPRCYGFWPVQTGMGASTLDSLWCVNGIFVAIETKRKGGKPTARQWVVIKQMKDAEALVYVVDDDNIEWTVNDIADKCYPKYSCKQEKDAQGLTKISPLVLAARGSQAFSDPV